MACALWPLSVLFSLLAALRRRAIRPQRLPVPVVVVGGITVGGSGKTPLTLWLVEALRQRGYRPGIISRGYGGQIDAANRGGIQEVKPNSAAAQVGDEPLLLCRRSGVPVFVGRERVAAGRALLQAHPECNLIVCDDGLQHYRLGRDVEIAVLDRRGLMNAWRLPAGPLREAPQRLTSVDALVLNDAVAPPEHPAAVFHMRLDGARFYRLGQPAQTCLAADLRGMDLHALAGIGEPQRFFDHLTGLGLTVTPHAFPDHHAYTAEDIDFSGDVILTTEKDAVKLAAIVPLPSFPIWVLPVRAQLDPGLDQLVTEKLRKLNGRSPA